MTQESNSCTATPTAYLPRALTYTLIMSAYYNNCPRLPQELWYYILELYYAGASSRVTSGVVPLMVCKDWRVSGFVGSLAVKARLVAYDSVLTTFSLGCCATSSLPPSRVHKAASPGRLRRQHAFTA
jgi:hypothetical protein